MIWICIRIEVRRICCIFFSYVSGDPKGNTCRTIKIWKNLKKNCNCFRTFWKICKRTYWWGSTHHKPPFLSGVLHPQTPVILDHYFITCMVVLEENWLVLSELDSNFYSIWRRVKKFYNKNFVKISHSRKIIQKSVKLFMQLIGPGHCASFETKQCPLLEGRAYR